MNEKDNDLNKFIKKLNQEHSADEGDLGQQLVARLRRNVAELDESMRVVNSLQLFNYIIGIVNSVESKEQRLDVLVEIVKDILEQLPDYTAKEIYNNLNDRTC